MFSRYSHGCEAEEIVVLPASLPKCPVTEHCRPAGRKGLEGLQNNLAVSAAEALLLALQQHCSTVLARMSVAKFQGFGIGSLVNG